jgi:hypothetical protein
VSDVFPLFETMHQMSHHFVSPQILDRHDFVPPIV